MVGKSRQLSSVCPVSETMSAGQAASTHQGAGRGGWHRVREFTRRVQPPHHTSLSPHHLQEASESHTCRQLAVVEPRGNRCPPPHCFHPSGKHIFAKWRENIWFVCWWSVLMSGRKCRGKGEQGDWMEKVGFYKSSFIGVFMWVCTILNKSIISQHSTRCPIAIKWFNLISHHIFVQQINIHMTVIFYYI